MEENSVIRIYKIDSLFIFNSYNFKIYFNRDNKETSRKFKYKC